MTVRKYISTSQETTLTVALTNVATTMTVISAAGLLGSITPAVGETFTVVIDPDTSQEEIVDVIFPSSPSSSTLTIVRNVEPGSTAIAHSVGAKVRHMAVGRDFREANSHIEATTGTIHGLVVADIVKVTDTGTVSTAMIAANAVTTSKIVDGTVTSAKIVDGTIVAGDIADGAITSAKILNDTIVNADINSAAAIAYSKLNLAGSITSSDITDGTIVNADVNTSAQIAYGKLNLTNAIVNADINASAAIDKTKISGTAITAADTGTVTSNMIADGAITNADINAAAAIALSKLATDPLARANHTGTQLASTVSDFDTQVRTSRLDQMAAPTGSVSANNQKITNLATPTSNTDAATKAYADLMIPLTQKGAANGVAELDGDGLLPANRLPSLSITTTQVVASQAAMLALTAQTGDVAVRTDLNKTFILTASPATTLANWQELLTPTDAVLSVDGQTGAVSLSSTYATVANAANKLPLAGGTMSGAIAMGSNKITGLGTPTATGDAATKDYADTKLALTGGTLSGALAMGTNKVTGLGDPTNAQDAATKNYIDTVVLAPSNLTGVITSVGNITSIASQTGTGTKFVVDTSPTLVTPVLGVATATSINGTTIPTSKTLVATDSTVYVVPSQAGNSGKALTTDGTTSSWSTTINGTAIPATKTLVTTDTTAYVSTAGGSTVTASGIGVVPLLLKGASGQTADLLQIQNNAGTSLVEVDSAGRLLINLATSNGPDIEVVNRNSSNGTIVARGSSATDVVVIQAQGSDFYSTPSYRMTGIAQHGASSTGTTAGLSNASLGLLIFQNASAGLIGSNNSVPIVFAPGYTERMRINASGNVGIGTTPSGAMLSILSNAIGNVGLIVKSASGQTADLLQVQNSAGQPLFEVTSAGNVGIGLATPSGFIHARKDSGAGDSFTTTSILQSTDQRLTLKAYWQSGVGQFAAIDSSTDSGGAQPLVIQTGGTERMRVMGSGNVGIGTTSPALILTVQGTGTSAAMPTLGTASGVSYTAASTGTYGLLTGVNYSTGDVWMQAQRTDGNATPYSILLNPSGGNVGIGGSSAGARLQVVLTAGYGAGAGWTTNVAAFSSGTSGTSGALAIAYDDTQGAQFTSLVPGVAWKPLTINAASTTINYGGTSAGIVLNSAGNVGIGQAPTAKLHVNGTGSTSAYGIIMAGTYVGLTAGNTNNLMYLHDGRGAQADGFRFYQLRDVTSSSQGEWYNSSFHIQRNVDGGTYQSDIGFGNSTITFGISGAERMRVAGNGLIGIGLTNPSSQLTVGANPPQAGAIGAVASNGGISLALSDNINNSLYVRHPAGAVLIGTDPGGGFRLATNGSTAAQTKLSIDTAGTATFTGNVVASGGFTGFNTGTNHGRTSYGVIFQPAANSQATYSNYPVGYSAMLIPSANGMPNSSHYFYFMKIAQRDNGTGWSGIAINFNNGDFWVGTTMDGTTYATWKRMANEILMGTAAPSGGVDGDVYVQYT